MTMKLLLEFAVLIGSLCMGACAGGVAPGLWGAVKGGKTSTSQTSGHTL